MRRNNKPTGVGGRTKPAPLDGGGIGTGAYPATSKASALFASAPGPSAYDRWLAETAALLKGLAA